MRRLMVAAVVVFAASAAVAQTPSAPPPAAPEPAPAVAPAPASSDAKALTSAIDALWARRDDTEAAKGMEAKVAEALAASPQDPEVLWRAARWNFWRAEMTFGGGQATEFGKKAWDLAEQAVAKAPESTPAHYWAAVGCGIYSEGIGIPSALMKGLEGKFRRNLDFAVAKNPDYEFGGPLVSLGRYWDRLPWPKHSHKKAVENLRAALARHPGNLRAKLFLAEALYDEGRDEAGEALKLVDEILASTPGGYDAPEERLMQKRAGVLKPKIKEELE